jgi:hypothetical protein
VDRLDGALGDQNSQYRAKRKSARYGPGIRFVRSGEFDKNGRRMVERDRADGQFKILRLTSDSSFAVEFQTERDLVSGGRSPASGQRKRASDAEMTSGLCIDRQGRKLCLEGGSGDHLGTR